HIGVIGEVQEATKLMGQRPLSRSQRPLVISSFQVNFRSGRVDPVWRIAVATSARHFRLHWRGQSGSIHEKCANSGQVFDRGGWWGGIGNGWRGKRTGGWKPSPSANVFMNLPTF